MATLPVRYTVVHNDTFTAPDTKREFEDLTHDMQYLSGCSTTVVSKTLPIHYVGLLRERIAIFVRSWYCPQNVSTGGVATKETKELGRHEMSQDSIKVHGDIKDEKFYI